MNKETGNISTLLAHLGSRLNLSIPGMPIVLQFPELFWHILE